MSLTYLIGWQPEAGAINGEYTLAEQGDLAGFTTMQRVIGIQTRITMIQGATSDVVCVRKLAATVETPEERAEWEPWPASVHQCQCGSYRRKSKTMPFIGTLIGCRDCFREWWLEADGTQRARNFDDAVLCDYASLAHGCCARPIGHPGAHVLGGRKPSGPSTP